MLETVGTTNSWALETPVCGCSGRFGIFRDGDIPAFAKAIRGYGTRWTFCVSPTLYEYRVTALS
jgi:hypothetical protein